MFSTLTTNSFSCKTGKNTLIWKKKIESCNWKLVKQWTNLLDYEQKPEFENLRYDECRMYLALIIPTRIMHWKSG